MIWALFFRCTGDLTKHRSLSLMEKLITYHVHSQTWQTVSPPNLLHNLITSKCTKIQKGAILSITHLKDSFLLI